MRFQQAFGVVPGDVVALIGAGGKTALMAAMGYELAEAGWRVLATTTTSLSSHQLSLFPCAMSSGADPQRVSEALSRHQFVFLHDEIRRGQVFGPSREWTKHLLDSVDSDILLVEADDAAGLPFKAPRADEPQIPLETSLVIAVASLGVLGVPLNAEHVYNPDAMIERYGFVLNSPVKSPWLAQVLRDEKLGLRGVPAGARVIVFLNQTPERGYVRGRARMIARLSLQSERVSAVALGAVRGAEPVYELQRRVGALVLATGGAGGGPLESLLAPCDGGRATVAHVAERLMRSRLDHIAVVTGLRSPELRAAIKPLGLKTVHDRAYRSGGFVSAFKRGLDALPDAVGAVLLAPGDLARLQPKVIFQLLTGYARGAGDFIVPCHDGRSGYPVLIGERYWPEILTLPGASDLPAVCQHFASHITFLDVDSDSVLYDGRLARLIKQDRQAAKASSQLP